MKYTLIAIGTVIAVSASYILYQHSLGAIPFLLASLALFYTGHRAATASPENNPHTSAKSREKKRINISRKEWLK